MSRDDVFGTVRLTQEIRSDDLTGLRLYVYDKNGYHRGGKFFQRVPDPEFGDEEISTADAYAIAQKAIGEGLEVRITNGSDFLVFHAMKGKVLFPADPAAFWTAAGLGQ